MKTEKSLKGRGLVGAIRVGGAGFLSLLLLAGGIPRSSLAQTPGPELDIAQYHHTRWTVDDGAPSVIGEIAQTPDGFLWLGASDGLYRFDGLEFERISPAESEGWGAVSAMVADRDGALWAWFIGVNRLAVYRRGRLELVASPEVEGQVVDMVVAPDGTLWAAQGQPGLPLYSRRAGRWNRVDAAAGLPRASATDMEITADGALWVSYTQYTLRLASGATRFSRVPGLDSSMGRMAQDGRGRLWHLDVDGARPVTAPGGALLSTDTTLRYPTDAANRSGSPVFDNEGNLWERTKSAGLTRTNTVGGPTNLDRFRAVDGLTSDAGDKAFRDREGSIWVLSVAGLDRFRRPAVVEETRLRNLAAYGDLLLAASDGVVYLAEANAIYRVPPGGRAALWVEGTGEPEGLCEGPDGSIWVNSMDAIRRIRPNGRIERTPRPPQAVLNLFDCAFDAEGRLLVAGGSDGTFRLDRGRWEQMPTTWTGAFESRTLIRDRRNTVWGEDGEALMQWTPGGWRRSLAGDRLPTGNIATLLPVDEGLLFAGRGGTALLRPDGGLSAAIPSFATNGLVRTASGDLWGVDRHGLMRMRRAAFERALSDPDFKPPIRVFGSLDGLSDLYSNQHWRSLVQGGDGRIWLATTTGVVWIDPERIPTARLAPAVRLTRIQAPGVFVRDPASVRLPAGTDALTISYAALSLAIPERVQVRYRLEGVDAGWIDPGQRRQAFYTNLGPGTYRFQVIAANEDGVWNREGATMEFVIAPTFQQSIWFKFLIGLLLVAMAGAAYVLRIQQVTAALRERFHIRIAERERIARELHDTLLQGVQGLALRFQSVANRLSSDDPLRADVETALERADSLMLEGRARVRDLRCDGAEIDLGRAIADTASDLMSDGQPGFQLTIEGEPRALDPRAAEELLRIAEEAMRNAVQHGQAAHLEAVLIYGRRELRLAIRDDGKGMPPDVLQLGRRDGHYGLLGMRERARGAGGELNVISRPGEGTEVSVAVPAQSAYRDPGGFSLRRLLGHWRLLSGGKDRPLNPRRRRDGEG